MATERAGGKICRVSARRRVSGHGFQRAQAASGGLMGSREPCGVYRKVTVMAAAALSGTVGLTAGHVVRHSMLRRQLRFRP